MEKDIASVIAHELRNPLAVIRANNELALMDNSITGKAKELIKDNIKELDKLSAIISQIVERYR